MAFFSWWYIEGWHRQMTNVLQRIALLMDMFSIDLILRTLFSPFRQIDANKVNGPLNVQMHAFIDKTVSRLIGALVRLAVLVAGCISIVVGCVAGMVYLAMWPLVPVLPLVGFIVMMQGWAL